MDPAKTAKEVVARLLLTQPLPLFAVVDGARNPRILHLVKASLDEQQSLYDGESAKKLDHVAPYLVRFARYSELLHALVDEGWGENWGIYLTCDREFAEVRKHFRHFLLVKLHDGREVYFRFYDPRVLRVFLPTCTPDESREFFGPINAFLVEDGGTDVLQWPARGPGLGWSRLLRPGQV